MKNERYLVARKKIRTQTVGHFNSPFSIFDGKSIQVYSFESVLDIIGT